MVELSEIQNLISPNLYKILSDGTNYEMPKNQALGIIKDKINIEIVEDRPASMDWIITPFAWIVEFLAGDKLSGSSKEFEDRRNKKYEEAFRLLDLHRVKESNTRFKFGEIQGLY
jgi:hypothetical protein